MWRKIILLLLIPSIWFAVMAIGASYSTRQENTFISGAFLLILVAAILSGLAMDSVLWRNFGTATSAVLAGLYVAVFGVVGVGALKHLALHFSVWHSTEIGEIEAMAVQAVVPLAVVIAVASATAAGVFLHRKRVAREMSR